MVDFVVVSLEGITHDEKIAAVARDRIPIDYIGEIAVLEKGNGTGAAGCARVCGGTMNRAWTANIVVPLGDSFSRCDAEEQSAARIDVVIFQVDALQPWIVPAQSFGLDKSFQQPFLSYPVNAADQRLPVV